MTRIIINETLRGMLHDLRIPLELVDENGEVVGRVFPVLDPARYEGLECPISREELDRRKQNKDKSKPYTAAEILAHLEKV